MSAYREVLCRAAGFEHVSRYISGLLLSENKTLQGIAAQQVYPAGEAVRRRAMHAAVFAARWESAALMQQHRAVVGQRHQGQGREVISLDWTRSHHEDGFELDGVKRSYAYVNHCMSRFQTVVTAVIAHPRQIDGIAVEVPLPDFREAERGYLKMTAQPSDEPMAQVMQRLVELVHPHKNQLAYRKRTEMVVDIVRPIEAEGQFPNAAYAFDNGVLTLALTQLMDASGKHWTSEIECSRLVGWKGQWHRVDSVDSQLRADHAQSFRPLHVHCRNGAIKACWALTKTVRLKRYGRKRLVIVHEQEDLSDAPRL